MSVIVMTEGQLGARLQSDAKGLPKQVFLATFSAAQRGKALLVKESPVDRGILRNAWKVMKLGNMSGVELINDQPYAGIMERGARPFKMSSEGIFALKGWVMRKIKAGQITPQGMYGPFGKGRKRIRGFDLEREAESIAYAIAKNFEKVGMKGKRFVMKNLLVLAALMDQEVTRYLTSFFNRSK